MAITKSVSRHVLLVGAPAWGHLKPLVALAAKFIHERPDIIISFTAIGDFRLKLEKELDAFFNEDEKALKDNIRFLQLVESGITDILQLFKTYSEGFAQVYPAMYAEEPVHCLTGRVYPTVPKPDVILLDPFLLEMLRTVRKVSGRAIPIIAWNTAALSSFLRLFGPESLGGLGNVDLKAERLAKETRRSKVEVLKELYDPETGKLVKLPGLPPMYDYEFNGQHEDESIIALRMTIFTQTFQSLEECDGILALANTTFEPAVCEAYRTWFAPRPAYFVGPLLPEEKQEEKVTNGHLSNSQAKESSSSSDGGEVKDFLDNIYKTHGNYSLLYISFGSHFWPMGEGVWKIFEVVLKMKIPLILSYNPKRAEMPSHLQKQLEASNITLVLEWAPQEVILQHPATAWFLTHCGNNSVTESVSNGVPMIAWPLGADQPVNAAYMSSTLNIAFELFEGRRGPGLLPLHRGIKPQGTLEAIEKEMQTVLEKAWGPDGVQKRENLHVLTKKINKAWNDNGEARIEFLKFLKKFVPN
ncbi:hypothetical protein Clacol_003982 [Clathrus columnatus]|uniref:UDP-Glycosyltransferase/glycogen phosphorylase n=1 Tax=Clathrus columnatus TaxID=1419009 RepID=A0AAV5A9B4_9AGAM|nr:hypothetical protein Clacol_003982 [Clathrus columnatus]